MAVKSKKQTPGQLKIRKMALSLAKANKAAEPDIIRIYWFPDEKEIRLVEVEKNLSPSYTEALEPFYFEASPLDRLLAPSAIAAINEKEEKHLRLPKGWGQWEDAEIWDCQSLKDFERYESTAASGHRFPQSKNSRGWIPL